MANKSMTTYYIRICLNMNTDQNPSYNTDFVQTSVTYRQILC